MAHDMYRTLYSLEQWRLKLGFLVFEELVIVKVLIGLVEIVERVVVGRERPDEARLQQDVEQDITVLRIYNGAAATTLIRPKAATVAGTTPR